MLNVDMPTSHVLPENSGAILGSYTKEEAKEWIAEYETAMSDVTIPIRLTSSRAVVRLKFITVAIYHIISQASISRTA